MCANSCHVICSDIEKDKQEISQSDASINRLPGIVQTGITSFIRRSLKSTNTVVKQWTPTKQGK